MDVEQILDDAINATQVSEFGADSGPGVVKRYADGGPLSAHGKCLEVIAYLLDYIIAHPETE